MKTYLNTLRRIPFTLILLGILIFVAMLTNTYFEQLTSRWLEHTGFAPNDLWYWRVERMFSSALVTSGGKVFWEALFFIAFAVGLAEWMTGWKRAAVTFWGVHILTLILLSLIVSLAIHQWRDIGLETIVIERDVGPSAGYFACLGLISARTKHPWHWVSGGALFIMFITALLLPPGAGENVVVHVSADLAHLIAFPLGWFSSFAFRKSEV